MFFRICVIALFLLTIQSSQSECQCFHLKKQNSCENSGKCRWDDSLENCFVNPSFEFAETLNYCSQFSAEDCRMNQICAFHLGNCQEFTKCEDYIKEKCELTSNQCISNTQKCIPKDECSVYNKETCQNKNIYDKYCAWSDEFSKCQEAQNCEELPLTLITDQDCRSQIDSCTASGTGGCIKQMSKCEEYKFFEQCFQSLNKIQCFWENNTQKCMEKICINKILATHDECQSFIESCTSNGTNCIDKLDCNQYQYQSSCVVDIQRNKCIYYDGKCYLKSCNNAPSSVNTFLECQKFEKINQCVPLAKGGCKNIPNQCQELETEDSCLIIGQLSNQYCFWKKETQKCKIKQCDDAPSNFYSKECFAWLNPYQCIGDQINGCIENKEKCELIMNLNSCVQDKFGRSCMIDNDQCWEEKCENLKYPQYDNPIKCQNRLDICTYDVFKMSCINKYCENLSDEFCDSDYQNNKCLIPGGCMHKLCESASLLYQTNIECEQWDIRCTINILQLNGIIYKNGCVQKELECQDILFQDQCITTLQGIECYWNEQQKQCEFHTCENAPITFTTLQQCQQWVEYLDIVCINQINGGCIEQLDECIKLTNQMLCSLGTINNVGCYWNTTLLKCEDRTCLNASVTLVTNLQCRQWLSSCILNDTGNGCKEDSKMYLSCTEAPNIEQFNTHDECQAWNPNCTIKLGQGCADKLECNQYLTQAECLIDLNQFPCKWNGTACIQGSCSDYPGVPNNHSECNSYAKQCTIGKSTTTCIEKKASCSMYSQSECYVDSFGRKCSFNGTSCVDLENQLLPSNYTPNDRICILDYTKAGLFYQLDVANSVCVKRPDSCSSLTDQNTCNSTLTTDNILCTWDSNNSNCIVYVNEITQVDCSSISLPSYTSYLCAKGGKNCQLNFQNGYSCINNECQSLSQSQCEIVIISEDQLCKWDVTGCRNRICADYQEQNITNKKCINWISNCRLQDGQCIERNNCAQETLEQDCNNSAYIQGGQKIYCYWSGINCQQISTCNNVQNSISHNMCQKKLQQCTFHSQNSATNKCIQIPQTCSEIQTQNQCVRTSFYSPCTWGYLGCRQYFPVCGGQPPRYQFLAIAMQQCQSMLPYYLNCVFNPSIRRCEKFQECKLIGNLLPSNPNCSSYSRFCRIDSLYQKCIINTKCKEALPFFSPNCDTFLPQYQCRKYEYKYSCQPLPQNCSDYKTILQCKFDYLRNQCYWSQSGQMCLLQKCVNIEELVTNHLDCEKISNLCTIDIMTLSCVVKQHCDQYQFKEQCVVDQDNKKCYWFNNQCLIDNCRISSKGIYTVEQCEIKYGSNCTINENRSGCQFKQELCQFYNKFQCLTPNQANSQGIKCFWEQISQKCSELICQEAPSTAKLLADCQSFNYNCMPSKCRTALCSDYNYKTDIKCANSLKNSQCTTNGQQCIERSQCENALTEYGCTYSIDFNQCQWMEDQAKCITKSCDSAPIVVNTHFDCQMYYPNCTALQNGGCIKITTCNSIQTKEGCIQDYNNEACTWDQNSNKCIYLICSTFCGDGITAGEEQCDDGNILPYDGCYKCKIQCQFGCLTCIQQQCLECGQGYELQQNGRCKEICGDGLIVGNEQCDDMNQIQYDGCFNCQFQCDQQCLLCIQGKCEECSYGYEQYHDQCKSFCGNGLLVQLIEQCDDGNTDNYDGCSSNCLVEDNWTCIQSLTSNISECIYQVYPTMELINLSQKKDSTQILKLTFSQELKLKEDNQLEEYLQITINPQAKFELQINPIISASQQLQNIEYQILVTLEEQIIDPVVTINIIKPVLENQQGLSVKDLQQTTKLGNPFILPETAKQKLSSTISFNMIMIYVFIASSSLSLLTGNFDLFFNMLALLQQLSYVRYLNIPFPSHLQEYLKVFKVVSFQPIYEKLNIDYYLAKMNYGKLPYIKSKSSNLQTQDESNAFFLINAKSFYITFFTTIALYAVSVLLKKTQISLFKYIQKQKLYTKANTIYKLMDKVKQFSIQTSSYFIYSGLIKSFITTQYQLCYSAYNQFPDYELGTTDAFILFNSLNAILAFILPHVFLFKSIIVLNKQFKQVKSRYLIFYENVKSNYWSRYYVPFSMIKVSCYMGIINFLYRSPIIQVIALTLLSSGYIFYLIKIQPLSSQIELLKVLFREVTFLIIVTGFFPYCLGINNDEILNTLGWTHIGLFSFIIGSNLIIDFYKQIQDLIKKYKQAQELKIKKAERLHTKNKLQSFILIQGNSQFKRINSQQ